MMVSSGISVALSLAVANVPVLAAHVKRASMVRGSAASSNDVVPPSLGLVGKRARQQRDRRGTDQKLDRAMDRHFAHIPVAARENKLVDGQTLRERLRSDLSSKGGSESRLGKTHWAELGLLYGAGTNSIDSLEPLGGEVRDGLVIALTYLLHENPSKRRPDKFCEYVSTLDTPLKKNELVGLVKASMAANLIASDSWDMKVLAIMACFPRFR